MAQQKNTKLKLLYLSDILSEKTDEAHPLSANELCDALCAAGIEAERKSVYKDIEVLKEYGLDIILGTENNKRGYFIGARKFELAELRLLLDAVQAANFISQKKTKILVEKIESFASKYQAATLHRQVYVDNRPKCKNEELYYTISALEHALGAMNRNFEGTQHTALDDAINAELKVSFTYSRRVITDEFKQKSDEKAFKVSPYALIWSDDHYYLVCNNEKYDNLMNLRIDRIKSIAVTEESARPFSEVSDYTTRFDSADYASKLFNMYSGEPKPIELICENGMLELILDKFGERVRLQKYDDDSFVVKTNAVVSDGLSAWLLQFGKRVKVKSPNELKAAVKTKALETYEAYSDECD